MFTVHSVVVFDVHRPLFFILRAAHNFQPKQHIGTYYTCAKSHFAKIPKHCKTKNNYLLITSHLKVLHSSILTILLITVNL